MPDRPFRDLDPEFAAMIGKIAVAWSGTELSINYAIWAVAGIPEALGACITAQIYTFDGRMKTLLALLKLRGASAQLVKLVNKFAEDARGLQETRNRIVHDSWGWDAHGEIRRLEITAPRKLKFETIPVQLSELEADFEKIKAFSARSIDVRKAIYAELPSWPEIPQSLLRPITDPLLGQ